MGDLNEKLLDELLQIGTLRNYYLKKMLKYRQKRNFFKIASYGTGMLAMAFSAPIVLISNLYGTQASNKETEKYEKKYKNNRTKYLGYEELYRDIEYTLYDNKLTDKYKKHFLENIKERIRLIELYDISISFDEALIV